ncbi:MAG: hypothetical protein GKR89_15140 [Candidatus Latescibacteria bacterium]|nr:hypothetical protein [Candidatus Latescibacterota bacterium]
METRPLGRTDRHLSALGLGCVTFGREIDQDTAFELLDYAVEKGITWFDTAEAYGGGNARAYRRDHLGVEDEREVSGEVGSSELILGRWLKTRGNRDQITLCTKVSSGNRPDNIARALATSLERLQTDRIDIYKLHGPDATVPIDESLDALGRAIAAAQVDIIGCSNFSAGQLEEALTASKRLRLPRFEITQPSYNLVQTQIVQALLPLCQQEEVAITPYSPLAAGFLAGKYTPDRAQFPKGSRFDVIPAHADDYFSDRNFHIVEELRRLAAAAGRSMVHQAMAWVVGNRQITSTLVGVRTRAHLDNALDALENDLSADIRAALDALTFSEAS